MEGFVGVLVGSRHLAPAGLFEQEVKVVLRPAGAAADGLVGVAAAAQVAVLLESPGELGLLGVEFGLGSGSVPVLGVVSAGGARRGHVVAVALRDEFAVAVGATARWHQPPWPADRTVAECGWISASHVASRASGRWCLPKPAARGLPISRCRKSPGDCRVDESVRQADVGILPMRVGDDFVRPPAAAAISQS